MCVSHAMTLAGFWQQGIPHAGFVGLTHGAVLALRGIAATIKASEQMSLMIRAVLLRTTGIIPFNGAGGCGVPCLGSGGALAAVSEIDRLSIGDGGVAATFENRL